MIEFTTEVVAAYVSNNQVGSTDLPALIGSVFKSISGLGQAEVEVPAVTRPVPAVPVKKSIHADFIVCLEDGKKLKMLKRYLASRYGMTPDDYRRRWGLSDDYPMVAPAYAAQRSSLALKIGLGRKRPAEPEPAPVEPPKSLKSATRRVAGRRKVVA